MMPGLDIGSAWKLHGWIGAAVYIFTLHWRLRTGRSHIRGPSSLDAAGASSTPPTDEKDLNLAITRSLSACASSPVALLPISGVCLDILNSRSELCGMSTVDDAIICSCGGAGMKVSEVLVKLHTFLVRSTEQLAYAKWMGAV